MWAVNTPYSTYTPAPLQMTRCDPQHGTGSDGATFLTAAKSRAALHRPITRQLSKTRSGLGERALLEQGLDIVAGVRAGL